MIGIMPVGELRLSLLTVNAIILCVKKKIFFWLSLFFFLKTYIFKNFFFHEKNFLKNFKKFFTKSKIIFLFKNKKIYFSLQS